MLSDLSNAELRLDLAEAEAERPRTIVASCRRKNRLEALTAELLRRGAF